MALTLKEIQAKLMQEQANKDRVKGGTFSGDSAIYPFWTNPDGSTATAIRWSLGRHSRQLGFC